MRIGCAVEHYLHLACWSKTSSIQDRRDLRKGSNLVVGFDASIIVFALAVESGRRGTNRVCAHNIRFERVTDVHEIRGRAIGLLAGHKEYPRSGSINPNILREYHEIETIGKPVSFGISIAVRDKAKGEART